MTLCCPATRRNGKRQAGERTFSSQRPTQAPCCQHLHVSHWIIRPEAISSSAKRPENDQHTCSKNDRRRTTSRGQTYCPARTRISLRLHRRLHPRPPRPPPPLHLPRYRPRVPPRHPAPLPSDSSSRSYSSSLASTRRCNRPRQAQQTQSACLSLFRRWTNPWRPSCLLLIRRARLSC